MLDKFYGSSQICSIVTL